MIARETSSSTTPVRTDTDAASPPRIPSSPTDSTTRIVASAAALFGELPRECGGGLGEQRRTGVARAVCASTIPVRTTMPPATCQPREHLLEPQPRHDRGEDRLGRRDQPGGGRREVPQRGDRQPERHDRAEDDDPDHQHPQRHASARPATPAPARPSTPASNCHHGAATAQNSAAATKLQQVSATGSRVTVPRSPSR